MNRPFQAFAALGLFLALAVLAVSSSSRSTSVRPLPASPATAPAAAKPRFSGIYVLVLPASADDGGAELAYSYTRGCGLDRSTGEVYSCSPEYDDCLAYRRTELSHATQIPSIPPVRMKLAMHDAALSSVGDSRDCLSTYDAAYDAIVYGGRAVAHRSTGSETAAAQQATVIRSSDLEWNQQHAVFHSLLGEPVQRAAKPHDWQRQLHNARAMWLGCENAALRLFERQSWLNDWLAAWNGSGDGRATETEQQAITWDDYSELTQHVGDNDLTQAIRAESLSPVQSGQVLLRFAAERLKMAGNLLSTVAAGIDHLIDESRLANQPTASQR